MSYQNLDGADNSFLIRHSICKNNLMSSHKVLRSANFDATNCAFACQINIYLPFSIYRNRELILIFFLSSTYLFLISFVCNFTTILPPPGIQWSAQL